MDKQVQELQNEVKLLKNEIKEVLTDIRSVLLTNLQNPFPTDVVRDSSNAANSQSAPANNMQPSPQGANGGMTAPMMPTIMPAIQFPQAAFQSSPQPYPGPAQNGGAGGYAGPAQNGGAVGHGTAMQNNGKAVDFEKTPESDPEDESETKTNSHQQSEDRNGKELAPASDAHEFTQKKEPLDHARFPSNGKKENTKSPSRAEKMQEVEELRSTKPTEEASKQEASEQVDLLTVITLASWIEKNINKIGREKLKTVVEIYGTMGGITPQTQALLLKMASLDDGESGENGRLKDYWRVLLDMDALFRKE